MKRIETFQKNNGLISDGIIGKNTLGKMMEVWQLNKEQVAHFIGQTAHETANFVYEEENLNYSAAGLLSVFGKYFPYREMAERYARKPEAIANIVYGNRMGNQATGDGWKYRGRGAIQLTGKNNYTDFAKSVNDLSIIVNPDKVISQYYFESALYYFNKHNIWKFCCNLSYSNIRQVTKMINGGYNGIDDRVAKTNYYYNLIA